MTVFKDYLFLNQFFNNYIFFTCIGEGLCLLFSGVLKYLFKIYFFGELTDLQECVSLLLQCNGDLENEVLSIFLKGTLYTF